MSSVPELPFKKLSLYPNSYTAQWQQAPLASIFTDGENEVRKAYVRHNMLVFQERCRPCSSCFLALSLILELDLMKNVQEKKTVGHCEMRQGMRWVTITSIQMSPCHLCLIQWSLGWEVRGMAPEPSLWKRWTARDSSSFLLFAWTSFCYTLLLFSSNSSASGGQARKDSQPLPDDSPRITIFMLLTSLCSKVL